MTAKRLLGFKDVRALLRLCNELHQLPPDCDCRETHLLTLFRRLVGARTGMVVTGRLDSSVRSIRVLSAIYCDRFPHADRLAMDQHLRTLEPPDPAVPRIASALARRWQPITTIRRQWIGDRRWYDSAHVHQVRRPMRIDDCLHSVFPVPGTEYFKWMTLNRPWGSQHRFTPHHAVMVHLVHSQLDWFYRAEKPGDLLHLPGLTPRLRETLQHLLCGDGEKQVAQKIGRSPHTVHVYVKALYKYFGVSSRAELLARCLRR